MNDAHQEVGITLHRGLYFQPHYVRPPHFHTFLEDYASGSLIHPSIGDEGRLPELPTLWISLRILEIASLEVCLESQEERQIKLWIPEEEIYLSFSAYRGTTVLKKVWFDGRDFDCGSEINSLFCRSLALQVKGFLAENADDNAQKEMRKYRELQFIFGGEF